MKLINFNSVVESKVYNKFELFGHSVEYYCDDVYSDEFESCLVVIIDDTTYKFNSEEIIDLNHFVLSYDGNTLKINYISQDIDELKYDTGYMLVFVNGERID